MNTLWEGEVGQYRYRIVGDVQLNWVERETDGYISRHVSSTDGWTSDLDSVTCESVYCEAFSELYGRLKGLEK